MPEVGNDLLVQDRAVEPASVEGGARLNRKQDAEILEMVRDATFITRSQIRYLCDRRGITNTRNGFNWRFDRLVKAKLVNELPMPVYPFNSSAFSITRAGLFVLEKFGRGLASITSESEHLASSKQAHHFLELNEIAFQFDRCFSLEYIMTDRVLRSRNLSLAVPLAKDYDALIKIDRTKIKKDPLNVGVEYELSVKSSDRYREISAALNSERHVRLVVYLCGSMDVANLLTDKIKSRTCHICFATASDFLRDGAETKMVFIQNNEKHSVTLEKLIELA